ncbi:MAG: hypothetical protein GEU81_04045 [Nitriliruptorales bacterium]|nr:hypothetical protein [Nitriliruptorales bacterium]
MRRLPLHTVGVLAFAMVVVGCQSSPPVGGDQTTNAETETATDTPPQPPTEKATIEPPEPPAGDTTVNLPGLPIGGPSQVVSGSLQCVEVSWVGPDIPDELRISDIRISFDPSDAFARSTEDCGGEPVCTDFAFTSASLTCTVPVAWTDRTRSESGNLLLSGVLTCPSDASEECGKFQDDVEEAGELTIPLEPAPPPEEPEETEPPTDEPTGETTDEPTGEPTG